MSLSRLPQVALRRLVPAITAVPKSLDDDQLKKMLEPQPNIKALLQSKLELTSLPQTAQQGLISALAKSTTAGAVPPAIGRLLLNLSGSQGVLSSQDLALIKAASSSAEDASLQPTPEPASPSGELQLANQEPNTGALDAASVDALVTALRGTAAISSDAAAVSDTSPASPEMSPHTASMESAVSRPGRRHQRRAEKMPEPMDHSDHSEAEDLTPISMDLSAAERRKEQNRRAQKKFRQKDKVRQKEIKWRASQYDELVESNKRFKRDIDVVSRERDQYRRILERHGIKVDTLEEDTKIAAPPMQPALAMSASPATTMVSPTMSPAAPPLGMDQIAQDTYGTWVQRQPLMMNDLLNSLAFGAVKADPMFAAQPAGFAVPPELPTAGFSTSTTLSSSDPLLMESPLVVDQGSMDPQYAQQTMLDSQFVDPMSFIDELLASPSFSNSSNSLVSDTVSRKRSYDDAMF
ncbi:hypothetical protein H4S02_007295 [Coemansia sp. RSA 2611]|nr:hypothetical protein H4S01_005153 [Coemansia sp. RSA 2610]KAJ2378701.1 hypothetical protein H4S02_007295 [Coemansia sp. RSA 2611]